MTHSHQQTLATAMFLVVVILGGWAWSQDDPATDERSPSDRFYSTDKAGSSNAFDDSAEMYTEAAGAGRQQGVIVSLLIFVLSVFLGIELISKVPPTLHTPLMSGSNAISGITLVGAVIVAAAMVSELSATAGFIARFLGFIAVTLAMINAVGGFLVTHRMLAMFARK